MAQHRSWHEQAACIGVDPEIFFPAEHSFAAADATQAKRLCSSCPVQTSCLEWAIRHGVEHGVFGGLDPDQRRAHKNRGRRRSVLSTPATSRTIANTPE